MPPLEVLELVFASGTAPDQPIGLWPADATAEYQVEPPGRFVDEVIHVRFVATVIVAREEQSQSPVHKDPVSEVDGLHARQESAVEDMAGKVVDVKEQNAEQSPAEQPRLQRAQRRVLIGNIDILASL